MLKNTKMKSELEKIYTKLSLRKSNNKVKTSTNIVIIDPKKNFYLGTRTDIPMFLMEKLMKEGKELKWTNAGGGLEFNESPQECAIREMKEEFNLDFSDVKFFDCINMNENLYVNSNNKVSKRLDYSFIAIVNSSDIIKKLKPQIGEIGVIQSFNKNQLLQMIKNNKIHKNSQESLMKVIRELNYYF